MEVEASVVLCLVSICSSSGGGALRSSGVCGSTSPSSSFFGSVELVRPHPVPASRRCRFQVSGGEVVFGQDGVAARGAGWRRSAEECRLPGRRGVPPSPSVRRSGGRFRRRSGLLLGDDATVQDCSKSMVILLITPPPIDEDGRERFARSLYGKDARTLPERTNEMAGVYAGQCIELAKEMDVHYVDIWSKMQAAEGWQKLYLSDGLHLTPEGNALVHKEVVETLRSAGLKAEDMPHDFPHHSKINGTSPEKAFQ